MREIILHSTLCLKPIRSRRNIQEIQPQIAKCVELINVYIIDKRFTAPMVSTRSAAGLLPWQRCSFVRSSVHPICAGPGQTTWPFQCIMGFQKVPEHYFWRNFSSRHSWSVGAVVWISFQWTGRIPGCENRKLKIPHGRLVTFGI